MSNKKVIFISAMEASAELHCANLIKSIKAKDSNVEFVGLGGDLMREAGCEILEHTVGKAAMIYKAFAQIGYYIKLVKRVKLYFKSNRVDQVIVCDSPAFNFHIAKSAKKRGIKTIFYVAPQLWAWAPWRIRKLKRCCDKLACILPFEREWFAKRNMESEFVGNPLFEEFFDNVQENKKLYEGYDPATATVALLPGSRNAEIESLWPAMQEIALRLRDNWPFMKFVAVAPSDEKLEMLREGKCPEFDCELSVGTVVETCKRVDFTFVASGSAVLQVAGAGSPMLVMFQSSRIMWHCVGKWLINLRFLSLVNILAARELVPEFMPYFTSIEPLINRSTQLLRSQSKLMNMSNSLIDLVSPLAEKKSSVEVADISLKMLYE